MMWHGNPIMVSFPTRFRMGSEKKTRKGDVMEVETHVRGMPELDRCRRKLDPVLLDRSDRYSGLEPDRNWASLVRGWTRDHR